MNRRSISLYVNTIRYLKPAQVYYQLLHRARKNILGERPRLVSSGSVTVSPLVFEDSLPTPKSYLGRRSFEFLNQRKTFENTIDWDDLSMGKLWAYNLNYFDFLNQADISHQDADELLQSFCNKFETLSQGVESYPISVRGINWIKYFTRNRISHPSFDSVLYSHYLFLSRNLEYHLMGNHLLENAFSLLFAAYYFNDNRFYTLAVKLLNSQLKEQILSDGAHFELSPMYHQIILFRLLDCINLVKNNELKRDGLLEFLRSKAGVMLGWLRRISFENGDIPMANDSALDIAPASHDILAYAEKLGVAEEKISLSDSGYRMIRTGRFELFLDIGPIGPDYIPGHAHSDTFNFVVYCNSSPFIVEAGTSTYETGLRRILERSTESHNTVKIENKNQSDVWASFRVGRRARIVRLQEDKGQVSASHDGYRFLGVIHDRTWRWNEKMIVIDDVIKGGSERECTAWYHFPPGIVPHNINQKVKVGDGMLTFENADKIELVEYDFARGFNKTERAVAVRVTFRQKLSTTIQLPALFGYDIE